MFKRLRAMRAGVALAGAWMVVGCATGPRTTVVLLPDQDGHVGAVSVSGTRNARFVDRAYEGVTVQGRVPEPSDPAELGEDAVRTAWARLLDAQPPRAETFVFHFILDGTDMTAESQALVDQVIEAARRHAPTEITVFGHADASGTEKHNSELSMARARRVATLLQESDPSIQHIEVQAFGASVPLPGTTAQGRDPRNRRVEVVIL